MNQWDKEFGLDCELGKIRSSSDKVAGTDTRRGAFTFALWLHIIIDNMDYYGLNDILVTPAGEPLESDDLLAAFDTKFRPKEMFYRDSVYPAAEKLGLPVNAFKATLEGDSCGRESWDASLMTAIKGLGEFKSGFFNYDSNERAAREAIKSLRPNIGRPRVNEIELFLLGLPENDAPASMAMVDCSLRMTSYVIANTDRINRIVICETDGIELLDAVLTYWFLGYANEIECMTVENALENEVDSCEFAIWDQMGSTDLTDSIDCPRAAVRLGCGYGTGHGTTCIYQERTKNDMSDRNVARQTEFLHELLDSGVFDCVLSIRNTDQLSENSDAYLMLLRKHDHAGSVRLSSTEQRCMIDAKAQRNAEWLQEVLRDGALIGIDSIEDHNCSLLPSSYLRSDYGPRKDPKVLYERIMREEDALNDLLGRIFKQDGAGAE
jgi:hypothetical protein